LRPEQRAHLRKAAETPQAAVWAKSARPARARMKSPLPVYLHEAAVLDLQK